MEPVKTRASLLARCARWSLAATAPAVALVVLLNLRTGSGLEGISFRVASGIPESQASREVVSLAEAATSLGGRLEAVSTTGPDEAVAAVRARRADFAVAPIACLGTLEGLEIVATIPVHVTLLLVGPDAGKIEHMRQLAGQRITVGLEGTATAIVASRVFGLPELASLGVEVDRVPVPEFMRRLETCAPGLVAVLARPDSPELRRAIPAGSDVASLAEVRALAARIPFTRAEVVPAASIDLGRSLPATDRQVLELPLGVITGPHVRRSRVVSMLRLLSSAFPELVAFNRRRSDESSLPLHRAASAFLAAGGPSFVDVHLPFLEDFLPVTRFAQLAIVASLFSNALGMVRRSRQGKLVARYRRLGREVAQLARVNGVEVPLGTARLIPRAPETLPEVERLLAEFRELREAAQRQSESMTAPTEGDLVARGIEVLASEWEHKLRGARARALGATKGNAAAGRTPTEAFRPGPSAADGSSTAGDVRSGATS